MNSVTLKTEYGLKIRFVKYYDKSNKYRVLKIYQYKGDYFKDEESREIHIFGENIVNKLQDFLCNPQEQTETDASVESKRLSVSVGTMKKKQIKASAISVKDLTRTPVSSSNYLHIKNNPGELD